MWNFITKTNKNSVVAKRKQREETQTLDRSLKEMIFNIQLQDKPLENTMDVRGDDSNANTTPYIWENQYRLGN